MKLLLALTASVLAISAADPDPELLDKRWYFGYMRLGSQVVEPPLKVAAAKRPWMWFAKDKTYQQSLDGKLEKGLWSFNNEGRKLTTTVTNFQQKPETTTFTLTRVTADSLELTDPEGSVLGFVSK